MLELSGVAVWRGRTQVLHDIDLWVGHGELVALIGANGAGKTTALWTISGLLRPRTGTITLTPQSQAPVDLRRLKPDRIVGLGVAHCPEGRQVFRSLSVRENLLIGAYRRGDAAAIAADLDAVFARFPILGERRGLWASDLSGGEQMMLAIGRALMSRPRVLLLDEPSLGLAPQMVDTIADVLVALVGDGMTILLVEQNARLALEIASRAYVLETGRVALSGRADELREDDAVRRAYLGVGRQAG